MPLPPEFFLCPVSALQEMPEGERKHKSGAAATKTLLDAGVRFAYTIKYEQIRVTAHIGKTAREEPQGQG